ncbi:MAG TPA: hypothetical protein VF596_19995 [Pyrinomonadaceae bacterium]|jgi:hypothetical protein
MRTLIAIVLFSISLCFCSFSARAQQDTSPSEFVKGDISEIKDKTRVFINTASNRQNENIIKALNKHQMFQVVNDLAIADYVIAYKIERDKVGVSIGHAGTPLQNDWVYYGRMLVYLPQKDNSHRLVWETRLRFQVPPPSNPPPLPDWRKNWEQPIEKSAIAKFIKALKKVRGEK